MVLVARDSKVPKTWRKASPVLTVGFALWLCWAQVVLSCTLDSAPLIAAASGRTVQGRVRLLASAKLFGGREDYHHLLTKGDPCALIANSVAQASRSFLPKHLTSSDIGAWIPSQSSHAKFSTPGAYELPSATRTATQPDLKGVVALSGPLETQTLWLCN